MTITQSTSAPLFAVLGATGKQGGSVVRAIQYSSIAYRVRAVTRDASNPAAKALEALGCSIVAISDFGTVEGARKAFEGADVVFAITMSCCRQTEFEHGKAQVDAANAEGVKTVVWSSQVSYEKLSNGKYKVDFMDVKQDVVEYARSLGAPFEFLEVQSGAFSYNFISGYSQIPRKMADGRIVLALPYDAATRLPLLDVEDYGEYVVGAVLSGTEVVHASPAYVTPGEMADAFTKVTGQEVTYSRLSDEALLKAISPDGAHADMARAMIAMCQAFNEVGYYGGADLGPSNKILARPVRTFEESLRANKEAVDKLVA